MEKTRKGGFSGLDSSVSLKQYEHWSNNLSYFLGPVSNVTCSNFGLDGLAAGTTLPLGLLPVDPVVANTNLVPAMHTTTHKVLSSAGIFKQSMGASD